MSPDPHAWHVEDPLLAEKVFAGQGVHVELLGAPVAVEYVPGLQNTHAALVSAPIV
jgi:hypothetical protein